MKEVKWFRFNPSKELAIVLLSWTAVVAAICIAFKVITLNHMAAYFIMYAVIGVALLGTLVPVALQVLIFKRPISEMGLTGNRLLPSIFLGVVLTVVQYKMTLGNLQLPAWDELLPLASMALVVGLYENIFYRGWVQQWMERSFGVLPGIFLAAAIYSLYHVGYGMTIGEMQVLFIIGVVYSAVYRLTSNIFIVYPLLTPSGALFAQIRDGLTMPLIATLGFGEVLVAVCIGLVFIHKLSKRKRFVEKSALNH